jgi:preprotein translocase subunit SecY
MFETLKNAFKVKEIRVKIWMTLFLLLVFRLGSFLPLPGIDFEAYNEMFAASGDSILTLLSSITGGALANASFLALGISPYINASIIIQLLTVAIPKLEQYSKQGQEGRRKISQITRIATLILAAAQSIGMVISWNNANALDITVFGGISATAQSWLVGISVVIILIAGATFTMWIGEKITELGIGNGISLLIFIGILATAAQSLIQQFVMIFTNGGDLTKVWELIGFLAMTLVIFAFIVWIDLAERRINIQYAKQVKGRKMMGGQSTYIPIKINASGVLPIIFATAIVTFPQLICQMFSAETSAFYQWWMKWLGVGTPIYSVVMAILIFAFAFFYAQIQFNPEDVSRNIQQYGGFINGIRPGKPTTEHLAKINRRLTLFGAIFLAIVALVPSVVFSSLNAAGILSSNLVNAFTATGLLIVVSVALEFDKQLQGQLLQRQYKGFLK